MWSSLKENPELNNLDIPKFTTNPSTPSFGQPIIQFTFNTIETNHTKTTQQSNLLQDTFSKEPRDPSSARRDKQKDKFNLNNLRTPLKHKKNLQVTSSWSKQDIINDLISQKKILTSKLEKSQEDNKRLTNKLELKCKQFELIKTQLFTLKQNLIGQNARPSRNQTPTKMEGIYSHVSTKESLRSSSSALHSRKSSMDFQRQQHPAIYQINQSNIQNYSHERMFKDRLQRVTKRLEVLQQQQNLIRFKKANNNSPYR